MPETNRLRTVRRLKDFTQERLADIAGVDKTTISDIERGEEQEPFMGRRREASLKALAVDPERHLPDRRPAEGGERVTPSSKSQLNGIERGARRKPNFAAKL
jgi:transcriptional regulator with XRE-family HTH domain